MQRLQLGGLLAAALTLVLTASVAGAETIPPARDATPSTAAKPYTLMLHRPNDFVAQTNLVQCVGASMQMMMNITERGADRTATTQLRLQRLARSLSGPRRDGRERQGASVLGWSSGLNRTGAGPYTVVGEESLQAALRTAALAMRATGRPVGLLVWRGRHAWVMTGFRATADPALTGNFRVTAVAIFDPLYPSTSRVWGPSPRPGRLMTVAQIGRQFVRRRTSQRSISGMGASMAGLSGKYVIVMPLPPAPVRPRWSATAV